MISSEPLGHRGPRDRAFRRGPRSLASPERGAVFRIDGVRQVGNPAPVAIAMPGLASCRLYTPNESERIAKIAAFADLARRHETRGNPDIAYGIVEIADAP